MAVRRLQPGADQTRRQDRPGHAFDASRNHAAWALEREHQLPARRGRRADPLLKPDEKEETMFSVIFEVLPNDGRKDDYLDLARHLKPILESIDGFLDNERFESRKRPGWVLSHSTWRDEKSVIRWRTEGEHHQVQEKGRFEIFQDYHLRVGDVTADTDPPREAPILE